MHLYHKFFLMCPDLWPLNLVSCIVTNILFSTQVKEFGKIFSKENIPPETNIFFYPYFQKLIVNIG